MESNEEDTEDRQIVLPPQNTELIASPSNNGHFENAAVRELRNLGITPGEFQNLALSPVGGNSNNNNSTVNTVDIGGGDFRGASLGPQDNRKELHFHKDQISDIKGNHFGTKINQIHHHHHYAAEQNETVERGRSQEEEAIENGDEWIQLSSNIRMLKENMISQHSFVYRGEFDSGIPGPRKLAVKLIKFNEKNVKEAKMLVKLALHHNVVDIIRSDVHYAGHMKFMYIAMELCHEKNLRQHIEESKANNVPFDPVTMNSYVEQVIEGLKFIHEHGILHRDLKLDNLLLSLDQKFVKICDFGLSKELRLDHSVTQQSMVRTGTVGYMAPETFNDNVVSKMSDIFSLGIVIYALWSYGLHPFGNDPDDWNSNIKKGRNRDLSQILVPNKRDATDLLEKVLQFEPRQRPTAQEIQKHEYFKWKDLATEVQTNRTSILTALRGQVPPAPFGDQSNPFLRRSGSESGSVRPRTRSALSSSFRNEPITSPGYHHPPSYSGHTHQKRFNTEQVEPGGMIPRSLDRKKERARLTKQLTLNLDSSAGSPHFRQRSDGLTYMINEQPRHLNPSYNIATSYPVSSRPLPPANFFSGSLDRHPPRRPPGYFNSAVPSPVARSGSDSAVQSLEKESLWHNEPRILRTGSQHDYYTPVTTSNPPRDERFNASYRYGKRQLSLRIPPFSQIHRRIPSSPPRRLHFSSEDNNGTARLIRSVTLVLPSDQGPVNADAATKKYDFDSVLENSMGKTLDIPRQSAFKKLRRFFRKKKKA